MECLKREVVAMELKDLQKLAETDPEGFREWAMTAVGAPVTTLDELERTGIDGRITFQGNTEGALLETVVLRVVPRKTKTSHVRDLRGAMEQEKTALGALVTMDEPTESILAEAAESGFYEHSSTGEQYPRVQVIRAIDLIAGEPVQVPRLFAPHPRHL
jgi:site-specific DNA-methyltransferase (adenine-specific)